MRPHLFLYVNPTENYVTMSCSGFIAFACNTIAGLEVCVSVSLSH